MINFIKNKYYNISMKYFNIILVLVLCLSFGYSVDYVNNYPTDINIGTGTYDNGTLNSFILLNDDDFYRIYETDDTISPININITIPVESNEIKSLNVNHNYNGGVSHDVELYIYDNIVNGFVLLDTLTNDPTLDYDIYNISGINVDDEVIINYKHVESGVVTHYLTIDYISVVSEEKDLSSSLGGKQVSDDNPLYIDFSNSSTVMVFGVIVILLVLSFLVILHPINTFIFFITTIILIANGFNILISFIMMLVSISLIVTSSKK